eukprot:TRINITY_DN1601_c9_g1_i1.p1 TRINITY_DN1601_c9_g1~~TRINITY_DN1601_c9_g1_i1.p1  ORF type:complete len:545 (+),score=138.85 TRINITY_DN1601_c9_g1_i1:69-1637(+)
MVVLAAAVLTNNSGRGSKVLLSRQYVEMTRIRIEGLLAALPRLMNTGSQHTFIETDNVRYVYQPFEQMLLVIVTNKGSNIVDDLDTLRLLGRLLPEIVPLAQDVGFGTARTEVEVQQSAFEIMFAFDEVISAGYRDNVTVDGVLTTLEMKSHEEDQANEAAIMKVKEAVQRGKEAARALRKEREGRNREKEEVMKPTVYADPTPPPVQDEVTKPVQKTSRPASGGLQMGLGKKKDMVRQIAQEDGGKVPAAAARPSSRPTAGPSSTEKPETMIREEITTSFDNDGVQISDPTLKGALFLYVPNDECSLFEVQLNRKTLNRRNYDIRPHPTLSKVIDDRCLIKTATQKFQKQKQHQILKWTLKSSASIEVPITVLVWGEDSKILVQYELAEEAMDRTFTNVKITIPAPSLPTIDESDENCMYDPDSALITWRIEKIDRENPQSGVNISWDSPVPVTDVQPLNLEFQASPPISGVSVSGVLPIGPGALWLRRRLAVMAASRRSSSLGKAHSKCPEVIRSICQFL